MSRSGLRSASAPSVRVQAPAKINVGLEVVSKRADGYHELFTVFQSVSLYDEVELTLRSAGAAGAAGADAAESEQGSPSSEQGSLTWEPAAAASEAAATGATGATRTTGATGSRGSSPPSPVTLRVDFGRAGNSRPDSGSTEDPLHLGPSEQNLVVRAARLLLAEADCRVPAIDIHLRKRIPIGAGLGGGSSDAAATLVGLNQLLGLNVPLESLHQLAIQLGADVPFFLSGGSLLGTGIGDELSGFPRMPASTEVVLVFPNVSVRTSSVFSGLNVRLTPEGPLATMARRKIPADFWPNLTNHGIRNDLEPAVTRSAPIVADVLTELRALGSPFAQVTGSGSAVYGLAPDAATARAWVAEFERRGWWSKRVSPIDHGVQVMS